MSTTDRERKVIESMKKCVAENKIWMTNSMFKLTDNKTELFVFAHNVKFMFSKG